MLRVLRIAVHGSRDLSYACTNVSHKSGHYQVSTRKGTDPSTPSYKPNPSRNLPSPDADVQQPPSGHP
jgi:hypothetical protein